VATLLVGCLLTLSGGFASRVTAEEERDLEPLPRILVFPDPSGVGGDPQTEQEIEHEIRRAFASLGNVTGARAILVRRFGIVSVEALTTILTKDNAQAPGWNAALTIAALRDVEGPALETKAALAPLVRVLSSDSRTPHDRAFAALALGCFHWTEAVPPPIYAARAGWYAAAPGAEAKITRGARQLATARTRLVQRCNDKLPFMRVAALLALAKMGGPAVRAEHLARTLEPFANPSPQRAALLTDAFLGTADLKRLATATRDSDRRIRAAAALALSVALLREKPAAWTQDTAALLKLLHFNGTAYQRALEDGAEAVFTRGVIALRHQVPDEWRRLWVLATQHTTKARVVRAAAQMLRFCDLPWFRDEVVRWAAKPPVELKPAVLALVLLRAGEQGTPEAIDALSEWLRRKSKRPKPEARWDPRWYAAVGLLRALQAGRIRPKADRQRVIEALERSAAQVLEKKTAFRAALQSLLDMHGAHLAGAEEQDLFRLPRAALRRIERAFTCPYDLMEQDAIDTCAARVNDTVQDVFGLNGIIPWKPGEPQTKQMPERFLKRYLDAYPYFSRLEFRERRGARPLPRLEDPSLGIDR